MSTTIQLRGDTGANWSSANPVLAEREMGINLDDMSYKIGNGSAAWNSLPYAALTGNFAAALTLGSTTDPSTPAANTLALYAFKTAGRIQMKYKGPIGAAYRLQTALMDCRSSLWTAPGNSNAAPAVVGMVAPTHVGTLTARNVAITNFATRRRRLGLVSAGTAGSLASQYSVSVQFAGGDGSQGGFHYNCEFIPSDAATVANCRMFVGLRNIVTAPTNIEPSTLVNSIGVAKIAASTNLQLVVAGSSAQAVTDLGVNFPADSLSVDCYQLEIFASPLALRTYNIKVTRLNTGHAYETTVTGNAVQVPDSSVLLNHAAWKTNNTTALAVGLDICQYYFETD